VSFAKIHWDFVQLITQKLIHIFLLSLAMKCFASVYDESVSMLHQPQCCQPECPPAMSVILRWPLATVQCILVPSQFTLVYQSALWRHKSALQTAAIAVW